MAHNVARNRGLYWRHRDGFQNAMLGWPNGLFTRRSTRRAGQMSEWKSRLRPCARRHVAHRGLAWHPAASRGVSYLRSGANVPGIPYIPFPRSASVRRLGGSRAPDGNPLHLASFEFADAFSASCRRNQIRPTWRTRNSATASEAWIIDLCRFIGMRRAKPRTGLMLTNKYATMTPMQSARIAAGIIRFPPSVRRTRQSPCRQAIVNTSNAKRLSGRSAPRACALRRSLSQITPRTRLVSILFLLVDARQKNANVPGQNVMLADVAKR